MTYLENLKHNLEPYTVFQNKPELLPWLPKHIHLIEEEELHADKLFFYQDSFFLTDSKKLPPCEANVGSIIVLCSISAKDAKQIAKTLPTELFIVALSCSIIKAFNIINQAIYQEEQDLLDFSDIWKQIENGSLKTGDQIDTAISQISKDVKEFKRLGIISFKNPNIVPITSLTYQIKAIFQNDLIARTNAKILILSSSDERNFKDTLSQKNREAIGHILKEYDGTLAISNATRMTDCLKAVYDLTERTANIMREVRTKSTDYIFDMEYYSTYTSIQMAIEQLLQNDPLSDPIFLAHPAIVRLTRYDDTHNDRLRDVCFYYLVNERNLQKTADATFMHRNTIINKIKKIKSMIDVDWEDPTIRQRLIFSCNLLRYYEKVMHKTVRQ